MLAIKPRNMTPARVVPVPMTCDLGRPEMFCAKAVRASTGFDTTMMTASC